MNKLFDFTDYRACLRQIAQDRKISYRTISARARIHASYFSRVMVGKAEFSSDQVFRIGTLFGLSTPEIDYLLLLREYGASSDHRFKEVLKEKIQAIQNEHHKLTKQFQQTSSMTSADRIRLYYDDSITAKVLMSITVPRLARDPKRITHELGIAPKRLTLEIEKLKKLGLVQQIGQVLEVTENFIHLDEGHPASARNHINWRLEAIRKLQLGDKEKNDYSFSACFSATPEARIQIKELFKQFVISAQKIVDRVNPADEVYFMNFDLWKETRKTS